MKVAILLEYDDGHATLIEGGHLVRCDVSREHFSSYGAWGSGPGPGFTEVSLEVSGARITEISSLAKGTNGTQQ